MPVNSHLDNVTVTTTLGAVPTTGQTLNLSKILIIDAGTGAGSSDLAGYTTTAVGALGSLLAEIGEGVALGAGLGADAQDIINAIFGAADHPESVWVLSVDLVGGDTRTTALVSLESVMNDYYAVLVTGTDLTVIAEVATAIQNVAIERQHVVFAGLADVTVAGAVSGTWDANAIGALSTAIKERLFVSFHDQNFGGYADFAEAAALYLTKDPEIESVGSNLVLTTIPAAASFTPTQKAALAANQVNVALPFFNSDTYLDPGNMQSGRPIYQIISADWFEAAVRDDFAELKEEYANRRRKVPLNATGQALGLNILNGRYAQGVRAGHFLSDEDVEDRDLAAKVIRADSINIVNRKLTFTVSGYFLDDAREFEIDVFLTS